MHASLRLRVSLLVLDGWFLENKLTGGNGRYLSWKQPDLERVEEEREREREGEYNFSW